MGEAKQFICD